MTLCDIPLIDSETIQRRVSDLAREINNDYAGKELVLAIVLKGALVFAVDLMRQLRVPVTVELVHATSYSGTQSSGQMNISLWPERSLHGQHIILVEDILDTGLTASTLFERLLAIQPASLKLCSLLDKPSHRAHPVSADYVGFVIDDEFVVGYGLDYEQAYRHLPAIYVLQP
ncbi:MAG: hypoxanthine phosphoribosyltransferase [Candidatus Hydrogenedentota bacterium]